MAGKPVGHESLAWKKIKNCRGQIWKKEFLCNLISKIYGGRKGFEIEKIKRYQRKDFVWPEYEEWITRETEAGKAI